MWSLYRGVSNLCLIEDVLIGEEAKNQPYNQLRKVKILFIYNYNSNSNSSSGSGIGSRKSEVGSRSRSSIIIIISISISISIINTPSSLLYIIFVFLPFYIAYSLFYI